MGYGCIYAQRTESHLTPREVKYLDRLFSKALVNTRFGRKMSVEGQLVNDEVKRMDGAESLYQQTGLYFFGDNEFAFRNFSDARESCRSQSALDRLPLLEPSDKVMERLSESLDKALVEVERRCTPSLSKPNAVYESPEYRNGAWQLYEQVRNLVPELLPTKRDRRTIKRRFEKQAA